MPAPGDDPRRDHRPAGAAPVVAYGDGAALRVPAHIAALGARRVMLVCGQRSFEASGAVEMVPQLKAVADVLRWSEFTPNTDSADLRVGLDVMRSFDPDLVLGVGGGSAMDLAKLLCAYRDVPAGDVRDAIRTGRRAESRRVGLVLVPTTSGSGAEATHFAVVYIGNDKFSIASPALRPDAIALDPTLSATGTPYQRATSGIDAVCQAIESLWATGATGRSRFLARVALRLLLPAIVSYVDGPSPESARAMCIGSHFAGRAIDISRTTAAHALSYGITKTYGLSHGHAVAVTLGSFIEAHAGVDPARLQASIDPRAHAAAMDHVLEVLEARSGREANAQFTALTERIGLDPGLPKLDAPAERRALAESVNAERLGNNPVPFTQDELALLIERVTTRERVPNRPTG